MKALSTIAAQIIVCCSGLWAFILLSAATLSLFDVRKSPLTLLFTTYLVFLAVSSAVPFFLLHWSILYITSSVFIATGTILISYNIVDPQKRLVSRIERYDGKASFMFFFRYGLVPFMIFNGAFIIFSIILQSWVPLEEQAARYGIYIIAVNALLSVPLALMVIGYNLATGIRPYLNRLPAERVFGIIGFILVIFGIVLSIIDRIIAG